MDEKTALTYAIVRALAYQENGGKPNLGNLKAGQSGELKSVFQFTPDTWKKDAKHYLGDSEAELTPDNETAVMVKKVGDWIDKGYNVKQMASIHNAGIGEPDAYSGKFSDGSPSFGKNHHGVHFDVPKYANSVATLAQDFYKNDLGKQQEQPQQMPQSTAPVSQTAQPAAPAQQPSGALGKLMMTKLGAPSFSQPAGTQQ